MQEFTIPSPEDETQETPPIISDIKKTTERKPTNKQTSIIQKTKFQMMFLTILLILIIIAIVFAYLNFKPKDEKNQEDNEVLGVETQNVKEQNDTSIGNTPASLKNKIFYTDGFNIYESDISGNNQKKLTDYLKFEGIKIKELELIDENNLGFFRCQDDVLNYDCEILRLNRETQYIKVVKIISNNSKLQQLTWSNAEIYAYSALDNNSNKISVHYKNESGDKQIAEIQTSNNQRNNFIEDDKQLKFSPDQDKIYYLNTSSESGTNFTINIYNLDGVKIDQIKNATMPSWIDNNRIVYRKYSNLEPGHLYIRKIDEQSSSKLYYSPEASYNPNSQEDLILFWEETSKGKSYIYDLHENESIHFKDNAILPVWFTSEKIIYGNTRECKSKECTNPNNLEYETQLVIENYYIYNVTNGKEEKIEIDDRYLSNGIVTWYNRHI